MRAHGGGTYAETAGTPAACWLGTGMAFHGSREKHGTLLGTTVGPPGVSKHLLIRFYVHATVSSGTMASAITLSWRWGRHCKGEQTEVPGRKIASVIELLRSRIDSVTTPPTPGV